MTFLRNVGKHSTNYDVIYHKIVAILITRGLLKITFFCYSFLSVILFADNGHSTVSRMISFGAGRDEAMRV
jgi:hypothetical protein